MPAQWTLMVKWSVLLAVFWSQINFAQMQSDHWIWAGITPADAPADADLIIYQGNFIEQGGQVNFEHKGIYPSPLDQPAIQLVFRLHELSDPEFIGLTVKNYIHAWLKHGVSVKGIQLDFDSPSAKLSSYALFLRQVRHELPKDLQFSITGLGTWMMDADIATLKHLHDQVDVVTYQLYVGRKPIKNAVRYLSFLDRLDAPFKVGLLFSQPQMDGLDRLEKNAAFKGFSYFIQK